MTKKKLLKPYKIGNKNYEILRLLWDRRGAVADYRTLMMTTANPLNRTLLARNDLETIKREKAKLKQNVKKLNAQLESKGLKIKSNRRKGGYYLKQQTGEN